MNSAIGRLRTSQENAAAAGALVIGFVVNYDAEAIKIPRADLKHIFEEQGFHGFVHETLDIETAIGRAKGRPLPKGMRVDMFQKHNDDTSVAFGVYKKQHGQGESGDAFLCGARIRVEQGIAVAHAPEGMMAEPQCLEVATRIAKDANELVTFAETVDVTTAAKDVVMTELHGLAMKSRGGLYFVRPMAGEQWQKLAEKLSPFGFVDLGFPMTEGVAAQRAAHHAVKTGLEQKLAELRDKVAHFDDKTRASNVQSRIADADALVSEVTLYAEILGDWTAKLTASVATVKACALRAADGDFTFHGDLDEDEDEAPAATPAPESTPDVSAVAAAALDDDGIFSFS